MVLVAAVVAALFIGFIMPRPTFVDNMVGGGSSEFLGTTLPNSDVSTAAAKSTSTSSHPLVTVDFYGESLCPDCQHMVKDVLAPLFKNGISDLMSLRYIAWGNVKGQGKDISCQHGPNECLYNRYINCAQKLLNHDQNKWFPYVHCMAENMRSLDLSADDCAKDVNLDPKDVAKCATGAEGDDLEAGAGAETRALDPPHKFVPWIVVNGVALGGAFEELDRYICVASLPERR